MLTDTIHAELKRLEVHPANLSVSSSDDRIVALQGSLLHYWKLPARLDGQWLLAQLRKLPDAAGPEIVMGDLVATHLQDQTVTSSGHATTQLRLFDPERKSPAK